MLQATIVKKYPAIVFIVFFQCLFATIQSAAFTVIAVRGASAWELRLDVGIIAILYTVNKLEFFFFFIAQSKRFFKAHSYKLNFV